MWQIALIVMGKVEPSIVLLGLQKFYVAHLSITEREEREIAGAVMVEQFIRTVRQL